MSSSSLEKKALDGICLDENCRLSLVELCEACRITAEQAEELLYEGIILPHKRADQAQYFSGISVKRAHVALRLKRDLRVNLAGAALALNLLDQIEALQTGR